MKNTFLKTTIAATLAISLIQSQSAMASTKTNEVEEHAPAIGLGTGVVVGAIVGGPIGATVAGIVGALLGNDVKQDAELVASHQALSDSQQELLAMHNTLSQMQNQVKATHVALASEPTERVLALETSIQFKTGSNDIEDTYVNQLELIVNALKRHPKLQVRLTGHADHRGDETFNQALSMQRALNVKQYLTDKGVNSKQILTVAVGEENSRGENGEAAFFERKVVMQIIDNPEMLTASR